MANSRIYPQDGNNNYYGGTTAFVVDNYGQVATAGYTGHPFTQSISIAGDGYNESSAGSPFGALRVDAATWAGPITLTADARIGVYGNNITGTVTGSIAGPYVLTLYGLNNSSTLVVAPTVQNTTASTLIKNGTVVAGNSLALSQGPLTVDGGILKLNGNALTFANLSNTAALGVVENGNLSLPAVLTIGSNDPTNSSTYSAVITDGDLASLSLIKTGTDRADAHGHSVLQRQHHRQ